MSGLIPQQFFKLTGGGQSDSIFHDKAAKAPTITFLAERAGQQRQMDVPASFIPGSETPSRHVFSHALLGSTLERQLPVMNGPGSVSRQMSDPAALEQRDNQLKGPV